MKTFRNVLFFVAYVVIFSGCQTSQTHSKSNEELLIIPKPTKRIKNKKLKDTYELQSYFIKRMEKMLEAKNKKLVDWDEILEGGLAPNATGMSWRGMENGIKAAKEGHHVIMTPTNHCYLDLYQGEPSDEPATYSMCRLSDCYDFEPVPDEVDPKLILGGQGNLWSEAVPTFRHAEYMTWPRGWALAEVFWSSKENKNWDNFVNRVEDHFERADFGKINYPKACTMRSLYLLKKQTGT